MVNLISWFLSEKFDGKFLVFACDRALFSLVGSDEELTARATSFVFLSDLVQSVGPLTHIDLASFNDSLQNLRILLHNFIFFNCKENTIIEFRYMNKNWKK